LRCQRKYPKKFSHYFDRYLSDRERDLGEDLETTKVISKTTKKLDKGVIIGANSLDSLKIPVSRPQKQERGERDTYFE